ncbi:MAG: 5'-methylthioadenosine/S-adenosylhomocysteine nucleosidase [Desulfobacteraceae bacterium]|nr:5'-methylthioadenosine/S-adenosylhomocysteine nucleosidase [Desulfobacteraceae bacterium]MBC2720992.1 5'-methylthioadenosine/S-adenosylhomocysteine nucleosidase [Desulfobacteraceae bacterium]
MVNHVDFAIITALEVERDAILDKFGPYEEIRDENIDNWTYYKINYKIPNDNTNIIYKIVIVMLPDMGNTASGLVSSDLIRKFNPKYIIMFGIAGGIKENKVQKSDVVIATKIVYYELGKVKRIKIIPRSDDSIPADALLLDRIKAFKNEEWKREIGVECPNNEKIGITPNVHIGPIACGEKVIKSNTFRRSLISIWYKLIAVEMESWGVSQAAWYNKNRPRFIAIRGICDDANPKKNDIWRRRAAYTAATYLKAFLSDCPVNPVNNFDQEKYLQEILRKNEQIDNPLEKNVALLNINEIVQIELGDENQKDESKMNTV